MTTIKAFSFALWRRVRRWWFATHMGHDMCPHCGEWADALWLRCYSRNCFACEFTQKRIAADERQKAENVARQPRTLFRERAS